MTTASRLVRVAGRLLTSSQKRYLLAAGEWIHALQPARRAALAHMQEIVARRPLGVNVQATSRCNARCVFCARRKLPQQNHTLPMELFDRLCRDYAAVGGGFLGFSPVLADPLLDPELLERVRLVRSRYPELKLHLFTNAIALPSFSDDDVALLLGSLEHVNVSIGGLDRDDYRTMFGVDRFEAVWSSLRRLGTMNQRAGRRCKLALHVRTHRDVAATQRSPALAELRQLGYRCDDIIDTFANWGGLVTQADVPPGAKVTETTYAPKRSACAYPMIYLQVMPDGRVLACGCMDAKEALCVGDLRRLSLLDIWMGEELARVRASFGSSTLHPLCASCTYYAPYERILGDPRLRTYRAGESVWGT